MGILRADRITGLGGANAIKGSVLFSEKQYFKIDNHEDFQFGTGEWTIEYWWNGHPNGGYNSVITTMITSNESGTWRVGHTFSGNNRIYFARGTGSGFTDVTFDVDVNDNKWHHIAFVRSSGTIIPFVDGVDKTATKATGSVSDGNSMTTTNPVLIGFNDRDNNYLHGHVSNLRVIKGTALYTSNFTPPTGELNKLSGTSLLCFQSPSDILQEETGKILQPYRDGATAGDQAGLNSTYAVATRFTPNTPVGFSTTTDVGSQYGATFDGFTVFATSTYMAPPGGNTRERNRGRGFFMVGYANPNQVDDIDYLNIQSLGNTISFGSLTTGKYSMGAGASSTRGIFCGGYQGGASPDTDINAIEFITIASEGNATDFGDRTVVGRSIAAASSSTRCVMASGLTGAGIQNTIDLVEFATAANAIDFGDLLAATNDMCNACNSPTRGIFSGGNTPSSPHRQNVMQFVTMASTGDATDYGDLTEAGRSSYGGTASSNTRGLILIATGDHSNVINFTTIATTGNASDFGDLFTGRYAAGSCSDSTRAVFLAGRTPSYINTMDTVTIATTGDAIDFGDVSGASGGSAFGAAGSDSHGGLS